VSEALVRQLNQSFNRGIAHVDDIARWQSENLALPREKIVEYLRGFNYVLSAREEESMQLFRDLVNKLDRQTQVSSSLPR
jgi:predicted solute-binding protein